MTYYAASVLSGAMEFGDVTHSFPGVFTVDVLVAWALVGLWLLVREPLVTLLPRPLQGAGGAAGALWRGTRARAAVLGGAVVRVGCVGALTHVAWDAFTHLDRSGMRLFPVLGRAVAGSPLYWYLQYGGSAVVIALYVAYALRRAPRAQPMGVAALSVRDRWWAGVMIGGCELVAAVQRATRWGDYRGSTARPWELIPTVCFGAGAGLVLGLLLYAVGVRMWRPARVPDGPGGIGPDGPGGVGTEPSRPVAR
jgi:hypothetical protein